MAQETPLTRDTCWDPFAGYRKSGCDLKIEALREDPDEALLEQIEAALSPLQGGLPVPLFVNALAMKLGRKWSARRDFGGAAGGAGMNAPDFDASLLPAGHQDSSWITPPEPRQGEAPPVNAAQEAAGPVPARGRTNLRQAYIAGSYNPGNHPGVLANPAAALKAASKLAGAGWSTIVPHASRPQSVAWDATLKRCQNVIQGMDPAIDCLVLLPGWEQSPGAIAERGLALRSSIRVLTLREALGRKIEQSSLWRAVREQWREHEPWGRRSGKKTPVTWL